MSDRQITREQSIMRILISVAMLGFGFYVLLSDNPDNELKQWAAGWIGAVVGYWLA